MVPLRRNAFGKTTLLNQDYAKIIIGSYISLYNNQRLHSANAFITHADQLSGRDIKIHEDKEEKD